MTITVYVVHYYENGRYSHSEEYPHDREEAHVMAKTFNACMGEGSRVRAVVQAVPLVVTPPDRMPTTEPFGPGMKPTRRAPAVV